VEGYFVRMDNKKGATAICNRETTTNEVPEADASGTRRTFARLVR
jgi:hypothetical protein